ncbi:MAG: hypothetical protein IPK80_17255 [Nannocystis sp.]|nr:hypothetical protein [Nannocystis sp.]
MRPFARLTLSLPLFVACAGDDSAGTDTDATSTTTTAGTATTSTTDTTDTTDTSTSTASTTDATTSTSTSSTTDATTSTSTSSTTDATETAGTTGAGGDELPPTESKEQLLAWLESGAYDGWAAESKIHPSTGPHGGQVRTFLNAALNKSLSDGASVHPEGAASVKELWGQGDAIIGWAVEIKVQPDSDGGKGWYWYELINGTEYGPALGLGLCSGCHSGGVDYVLVPFPLQ